MVDEGAPGSAERGDGLPVRAPDLADAEAVEILTLARLEPVGVLTAASNLTLLVELHDEEGRLTGHRAVYKPSRGERPLADFPHGTLAAREVASYLVSAAAGLDLVPPTVLRDGPLGPGSVQWWVDQTPERLADPAGGLVEILPVSALDGRWLPVVDARTEEGERVVVAHADDPQLRLMAVLDVVLNNADRKAAHLTLDPLGRLRGFDHGLCLHVQDKLRTVLWGWAAAPLVAPEVAALGQLSDALTAPGRAELEPLLHPRELEALGARVAGLLSTGAFPEPPEDRYPLPWPLW